MLSVLELDRLTWLLEAIRGCRNAFPSKSWLWACFLLLLAHTGTRTQPQEEARLSVPCVAVLGAWHNPPLHLLVAILPISCMSYRINWRLTSVTRWVGCFSVCCFGVFFVVNTLYLYSIFHLSKCFTYINYLILPIPPLI